MFSIKNIKERREEGFTLIELLIVIVIIGVLASIGVPMYLNQAVKADKVKAKANVAAISSAIINGASTSTLSQIAIPTGATRDPAQIYVSHTEAATFVGTIYTDSLTQPIPVEADATKAIAVFFTTSASGEVGTWCVSQLDGHGGSYSITSATGSIAESVGLSVCVAGATPATDPAVISPAVS